MSVRFTPLFGLAVVAFIASTIAPPAYSQQQTYSFDIPAQDLDAALRDFVQKTRVQVIFDGNAMRGKRSQPLQGQYSVEEAIAALLRGSGMIAQRNAEGVLVVSRSPADTPAAPTTSSLENDAASTGITEIIVTAQRREQSVQDVPVSMSVATGETLRQGNINTLEELAEHTAGIKIAKGAASDQLHVRGTGSSFNFGFEQSVAMFVDGIYRGRSRAIRVAFFDVERVEVLKGPQTTFFGANAIAGAINITTKAPGNIFEGNARALYAPSDGEYNLEAATSVPFTEDFAVRVAGRLSGMDGYTRLVRQNTDGPNLDDKQGRVSLRWDLTDRLTIDARYDIARLRDKGVLAPEIVGCPPETGAQGLCARALGILGDIDDELDYRSDSLAPGRSNMDLDEAALTASLDLDAVTLVSTSGYLKQSAAIQADLAPYPVPSPIGTPTYLIVNSLERLEQFSQEIRLQSNTDGPVSYMIGGYYEHGELIVNSIGGAFLAPFGAAAAPVYTATTPIAAAGIYNQDTETWSGFASVSYELIDRLTLTGGLRYTTVRKKADRQALIGTSDAFASEASFVPGPASVQFLGSLTGNSLDPFPIASRTDDKFMPSANIRYEIAPDAMIYASYARGFKAGGYSFGPSADTFEPEVVDNYEIGMKASWWDRRLTTNLTLFRADYSNLQEAANIVSGAGTVIAVVTNAAESRSTGVEFNGSLRLGNLTVATDLAYVDAYYVSYPNAPCTAVETATGATCPRDISGRRRAFAPEWSGSVSADYRIGLNDANSLRLGGTVYSTSAFYLQTTISDLVEQEGYAKLDLRAAIGPDDRRWEIAVIGKNLTDKTTASFVNYLPAGTGSVAAVADRPRSVAIQASMKW